MKFIGRTVLKIYLYVILIIIPLTLLVTCFTLTAQHIPLWNIGIRNIIRYSTQNILPSIFISYLIATIVVVSFVDKMKVRSLFLLHIPAVIAGALLGAFFYLVQAERIPIFFRKKPLQSLQIGVNTFFRTDTFNEIEDRTVYIHPSADNLNLYVFNRTDGHLFHIDRVNTGKRGRNYIWVDVDNRLIHIVARQNSQVGEIKLPFSSFKTGEGTLLLKAFSSYRKQVVTIYRWVVSVASPLGEREKLILIGALYFSVVLISIPLAYGFNDRGWNFSGAAGVFLLLVALPYFYGFVFRILDAVSPESSYMGRYYYLFPALIFCIVGIVLDILVKMSGWIRRV